MYLRSSLMPLLLLVVPFQPTPQDSFRQHYEAAEAQRRAGNLAAAEAEYFAFLADGYAKLGKIYLAQSEFERAATVLESAAAYRNNPQDVLIDLAIAYFNEGHYRKALEPLDLAVAHDANSAGAHHMLGKSYFMLGEFDKSANELKRASSLAPDDPDVSYSLALAYLKQHQFAPAKQIYDRMIQQLGNRPQLRVLIGRAYRETGFLPQAIDELKQAVALDSHFPRVHYYLGLTYLLKDGAARLDDAAHEFRLELATHPDEFFANYYLGIVATIQRDWRPALGLLQKAVQIQPNNPDAYFYLGQAYQGLEQPQAAIEAFKNSIALTMDLNHNDYQVTAAHYRLGQSLIKVGRTDEGQRELQLAADLKLKGKKRDEEKAAFFLGDANLHEPTGKFPELHQVEGVIAESILSDKQRKELKDAEAYYSQLVATGHNNVGLLRAEQQNFQAAAEQFALAAKWDPQLTDINFNLGLARFRAESYARAITPLENDLRIRPKNVTTMQLLGLSYFMVDDFAKAAPLLTVVVSAKPDDVGLNYALAFSLIKVGQKETADRLIKQLVSLSGDTPQLHILFGQAYYQQNDIAKALDELKMAVALDPKTRLVHYYTGLIYLKMGKFNEAAREFESELTLNSSDLRAKYHLGFVLLADQKTESGIKEMREVIRLQPDYAEAHYELGKALLPQGDIKGAVEQLEIAAKLQPERSYVHYQLGRAYLAAGRKQDGENQLEISQRLKEKERSQSNP